MPRKDTIEQTRSVSNEAVDAASESPLVEAAFSSIEEINAGESTIAKDEIIQESTAFSPLERNTLPEVTATEKGATENHAVRLPSLGKLVHKGVYMGFYGATYSMVFGTLMLGSLIPSDSAMGQGMRDGLKAAQDAFAKRKNVSECEVPPTAQVGLAGT